MQYLLKSSKTFDEKRGWKTMSKPKSFKLRTKNIKNSEEDNMLMTMSLGELSDFYIRGMESSSDDYCRLINIILQNGDTSKINHENFCCCKDSVIVTIQLTAINDCQALSSPKNFAINPDDLIINQQSHRTEAKFIFNNGKLCCQQTSLKIYKCQLK